MNVSNSNTLSLNTYQLVHHANQQQIKASTKSLNQSSQTRLSHTRKIQLISLSAYSIFFHDSSLYSHSIQPLRLPDISIPTVLCRLFIYPNDSGPLPYPH